MEAQQREGALKKLEDLTDTILNADRIFPVEFIFDIFTEVFPAEVEFAIILRERRRFVTTEYDELNPYLNFNFLSFEWRGGVLHRFDNIRAIDTRVAELEGSTEYRRIDQHGKLLCFVRVEAGEQSYDLVKAAARCLGVFYYTCGSYDHFIGNVSTRFLRDYFKEHKQFDVADIVKAVETVCHVRAAYLTATATAEKITVVSDPSGIYAELVEDPAFSTHLQKSYAQKSAMIGQTASGFNYVIHTLSNEYFDHSRPLIETAGREKSRGERFFAYAPRGIVVTAFKDALLELDVLSLVPRIFRAYANDQIFSAREEFFYGLLRDGGKLADQLLVEPAETGFELRARLYPLLDQACRVLIQLTYASSVAIRAYDPFEKTLLRVGAARQPEINGPEAVERVPVEQLDQFASARAYSGQHSEGLAAKDRRPEGECAEPALEVSADFGGADGHVASIPIKVGAIVLGTLDFFTNDRKFFANDRQYLDIAAAAIGELIRRVEASNDSAWLSRLSFLHSARHELGRFSRNLERTDVSLAEQLRDILRQYSSLNNTAKDLDSKSFGATLRALLAKHELPPERIEAFVDPILEAVAGQDVPSLSLVLLQEVLENLLQNARAHSDIDLTDIEISYLGVPGQPPSALMLHYRAEGSPRRTEILGRICVAPIQEVGTTAYHYGLFLLATQLRMAGGYASGRRYDEAASVVPFEVSFGIPLN